MKIRVQHANGEIEVITIDGSWGVHNGEYLNHISNGNFDHFFTHDGHYDGWGGAVSCSAEDATSIIEAMEGKRERNIQ